MDKDQQHNNDCTCTGPLLIAMSRAFNPETEMKAEDLNSKPSVLESDALSMRHAPFNACLLSCRRQRVDLPLTCEVLLLECVRPKLSTAGCW